MTNSTINIAGLNENMVSGFFAKGNRLWFGDITNSMNTVAFEGETDEDFFEAAREATKPHEQRHWREIGFYAVPILNELDWCGGERRRCPALRLRHHLTQMLCGGCK